MAYIHLFCKVGHYLLQKPQIIFPKEPTYMQFLSNAEKIILIEDFSGVFVAEIIQWVKQQYKGPGGNLRIISAKLYW